MKILLINNHHSKVGGAETVYFNTIELLLDNGHEVVTLSRKDSRITKTRAKEYFIEYSDLFLDRLYSFNAKRQLVGIIEREKPQVAHLHNIVGGITFSILPVLKKYRIPIILSIHDYRLHCPVCNFSRRDNRICEKCSGRKYYNCILGNCSPNGILRSIAISVESYLRDLLLPFSKYVNQFIFVSDFSRRKFFQIDANLFKSCSMIYNFTEINELSTENEGYFLFFGRLTKDKGLLTLLKAFRLLPNAKLKILGEGPLKNLLTEQCPDNVELLGFKSGAELNEIIRKAYFVVVPSEWYENNPMSIVESFAAGKPVIGSDIGGISELIIDGINGYKFTVGDHTSLQKKLLISQNLTDSGYKQISEAAFNFAKNNFSKEVHYNKLLATYVRVLDNYLDQL